MLSAFRKPGPSIDGMKVVLLTVDESPETVSVCETCMKTRSVKKAVEGMNMALLSVVVFMQMVLLCIKIVLLTASDP